MKFIEKILSKRGFVHKRVADKNYLRGYAAAQSNRFTSDWHTSSGSADREIMGALAKVRDRARDIVNNNDYGKKYIQLCVNNIVGADGFVLQNKAKDVSGNFDKAANKIIEDKFWEWSNKKYCTVNGRLSFRAVQELIIKTVARDGEAFVRKIKGKNVNKFGFALQVVEPDFIDEKYNTVLKNGNVVRMGIELDQNRTPVAYYIKQVNPETELYSHSQASELIRIPADEIIHIYDPERANQTRGISWMVVSIYRLRQLSGFEDASLINARVSAHKMGFFKKELGSEEYKGEETDESGNIISHSEPGIFETLPAGFDFVPYDPKYPTDQHDSFVKSILRAVASGLGVSYNTLANDLEGVNYSSIRAGLLDERDNWKRLQSWFIESFLLDVFETWLEMALLIGEIPLPYSKFEKFNQPLFMGRRWQWVDPLKDVLANIEAVNAGFKTNADVLGEQGKDLYETYEQLKIEKELLKKYGLQTGEINEEVRRIIAESINAEDDDTIGRGKRSRKNH